MRRFAIVAVAVFSSVACSAGSTLAVDLRTDLVPGVEFSFVETRVSGGAAAVEVQVAHGDAYLEGARVAEIYDLAPGTYGISVTLLDEERQVVAERSVLVTISTTITITMLVSRDCAGLSCPESQTCFGGRCVDRGCLYGDEDECPDPECSADTDCTPAAACASARCTYGVCQIRADDAMCGAGQYCHPDCACIPTPPDPDAGSFDPALYCGACGVDCTRLPRVTAASCGAGACVIERCEEGYGDCDRDPSNGCESTSAPWRRIAGGDHCGGDWTLTDGLTIAGEHVNVGRLVIPLSVTVHVADVASGGGELEIHARSIEIHGVLNGNGSGHPGGVGGRGERSGNPYCGGDGDRGSPGAGPAGGAGGEPGTGNNGTASAAPGCRYANGGDAGGGQPGRYGAISTENDDVPMGSGGGGGGGGGSGSRYGSNDNYPAGTGGGGGAGGSGGASIRLFATDDIEVRGTVRSRGTTDGGDGGPGAMTCTMRYGNPDGGYGGILTVTATSAPGAGRCMGTCDGGASNTCGGDGGAGGAGAGGGVLLSAPSIDAADGTIDVRDGLGTLANAGAIKLRFACTHVEGSYLGALVDPQMSGACAADR